MYLRRTVDELLDTFLPQAPAIALDGAKGVGKTGTALQRATKGSHPILYSSFHARSFASLARAAASAKAMKATKYTTSRVSMTPRCIDL